LMYKSNLLEKFRDFPVSDIQIFATDQPDMKHRYACQKLSL